MRATPPRRTRAHPCPLPSGNTGEVTTPRAPQSGAEGLSEPLRSRWSLSVYDDEHTLDRPAIDRLLRPIHPPIAKDPT